MTLYKSTVDVETFNMTLGLIIQPGDIIDIDYENRTVTNQTSGMKSKVRDLQSTFEGKLDKKTGKISNTLKERIESGNDGNFTPYKESKTKTKKGGS
jgi:dihydroxyacid dehydratase/phosphogluconate dehydratase